MININNWVLCNINSNYFICHLIEIINCHHLLCYIDQPLILQISHLQYMKIFIFLIKNNFNTVVSVISLIDVLNLYASLILLNYFVTCHFNIFIKYQLKKIIFHCSYLYILEFNFILISPILFNPLQNHSQ